MKRKPNWKRRSFALLLALSMAVGTVSASAVEIDVTTTSLLTGESVPNYIGDKRPIAVMFNNIYDGIPQCGIENSGVIYEAPVEGGITRLMGIMEDYEDAERIGSVRSCRNYFIYVAREFHAIYCHFGQAVYAEPILNLDSTQNLSGLADYGEQVYYRSDDRVSPHNVFTDYDRIQRGIELRGYQKTYAEDYEGHYRFAPKGEEVTLADGEEAIVVLPGYSYNHARFQYNEETGLYERFQYNEPHVDGNSGEQLTCKNILLQYCDWEKFDENGYLNIDMVNGGEGKYITNGRAIDITWEKENATEDSNLYCTIESQLTQVPVRQSDFNTTRYYDRDGKEITLNPGRTWVCIVLDSYADDVTISADPDLPSDAFEQD